MKVPLAVAMLLAATLPFILDSIGSMIIVGIIIACVWRQKSEDMISELAAHTKGLTKEKYKLTDKVDELTDKVDELKVKVDELNGKVKRRQKELRVEVEKKDTLKGQVRKLKGQVKELKVEKERREKAEANLKKLKAAKPAIVRPPRVGGTAAAKLKRAEAKILEVEGLRAASHIRHDEQIQRIEKMVVRPWHYARITRSHDGSKHSKDPSSGRHFVANLDTGNQSDTIISKALYDALGGASAFPPTGRQVGVVFAGGHVVQQDVVRLRYELDGVAHGELLVDATVSTASFATAFSWDLLISVKDITKLQDYKMVVGNKMWWSGHTTRRTISPRCRCARNARVGCVSGEHVLRAIEVPPPIGGVVQVHIFIRHHRVHVRVLALWRVVDIQREVLLSPRNISLRLRLSPEQDTLRPYRSFLPRTMKDLKLLP